MLCLKLVFSFILLSFYVGCAPIVEEVKDPITKIRIMGKWMFFQLPPHKKWYKVTDPWSTDRVTYISGDNKDKYAIIIEAKSFQDKRIRTEEDIIKRGDEILENQKGKYTSRDQD